MTPWDSIMFYFLVLPVALAGAWALTEMFLEHRPTWRRGAKALIAAVALADLAFLVATAVVMSGKGGCPVNGCS